MILTLDKIRETVIRLCEASDCIYVLLFGSRARGDVKDYSDVDIAVKFSDAENSIDKALDLMSAIEEELGVSVDVVPLNVADTIIKYEAYSQGILLFCKDYERYIDDYVNAIDEYLDFEPIFNRFYQETLKEIRDAASRS
ncbi:MAG: nucleotidyltransferase domain-containing protein [Ignisphaera sp.]